MNKLLKLIVCIKQVPDTPNVKINPETNTLIREGIKSIINPFDMYAIEEGIRLKEKYGGRIMALSMGLPQVESSLREAIAMGVDDAYLLTDGVFAGSDTLTTAFTISVAIKKIDRADIILMGRQAIDGDTGQVGPEVAENLGIPHITNVRKINKIDNSNYIFVERLIEDAYIKLKVPLPVLLTVVKEINEPRLPSLKDKILAKKKRIRIWSNNDLKIDLQSIGLNGSPTRVIKVFTPSKKITGKIFQGETEGVVNSFINELKDKNILSNVLNNRK